MSTFTARVEASELASALSKVSPTKGTYVELSPDPEGLLVLTMAGDDLAIDSTCTAAVSGPPTRVSFAPLVRWAHNVEGAVNVELDEEGRLVFQTLRSKLSLAIPGDDVGYIWKAAEPDVTPLEMGPAVWSAIERCAPAATTDDQKAQFKAVVIEDGSVWATDSYRFHFVDLSELEPLGHIPLPLSAMQALKVLDLANVVAKRDNTGRKLLHLSDARTHVAFVLASSEPFNPRRVLGNLTPKEGSTLRRLTVERKALEKTLKDISGLVDGVTMTLSLSDGVLTFGARMDGREATFDMDASGEDWPTPITMNQAYFSGVVDALVGDSVTFDIYGGNKPAIVQEDGFIGIVLSVKVADQTW